MATQTEKQSTPARICSWDNDPSPVYNFYTTGNVEEIVPGVPTPFVATFFQDSDYQGLVELHSRFGVDDLMQTFPPPVSNFISVFAGRFALNLAWANAIIATWQTGDGSGLMEQFITTDKADVSSGAISDLERAARNQRRVYTYFWPQCVAAIDPNNRKIEVLRREQSKFDLSKPSDAALMRYLLRLRKVQTHLYASHLGVSGAAGEYSSIAGKLLAAELGENFNESMVAGLTTGLGDVESARPGFEIWKLGRFVASKPGLAAAVRKMHAHDIDAALNNPRDADWKAFAQRFKAFIAEYGFRGQSEADPSMPGWNEDHTFVLSVIKTDAAAPADRDPLKHAREAQRTRDHLEATIARQLSPGARREFLHLAERAQKYARNRERTKACWVRALRLSRPVLLEMARRCDDRGLTATPADFWYLTWDEVRAIFAGKPEAGYLERIAARKEERKRMEKVAPPEVFEAPPTVAELVKAEAGVTELSGLGVSAGVATGRARVITSAAAAEETDLEAGEVLVAPFTDAAWTPLFVPAAAVVVETGGTLSHAATVAREYGIPAVVAVRGATSVIRDGQKITVDGAAGLVTIG